MEFNIFQREIAFGIVPFETIYFNKLGPQFAFEHYKRLKRNCKVFKIPFTISYEEFESQIHNFIKKDTNICGALKLCMLGNKLHFNIRRASYTKEMYNKGLYISTSKSIRDVNNIFNIFKTYNYGINYIEDLRAKKLGYDTALFLNNKRQICETSYANIFFRNGNNMYTPHVLSGILKGIMREEVIKFSRENGFKINKCNIKFDDIKNFEECFITNSLCGIFPVKNIDKYDFNNREFCNLINSKKQFIRSWNICI